MKSVTAKAPNPPGVLDLRPEALADRQLASDRERTARFPQTFTRKLQRMSASPLAYLRGAAPMFYDLLIARPELAAGPEGEGWIVGDMHLENVGAYRGARLGADEPAARESDRKVQFDLNDFDDAVTGPWRYDVLRLATSLLLGGRELGATGIVALELCDRLFEAWARSAFDGASLPPQPSAIAALCEQVRARSKSSLLEARTTMMGGKRCFVRGPRYAELAPDVAAAVPAAFAAYVSALPEEDRPHKGSFAITDCALRIAGTGSLGGLRIAVLVKGKGGPNGAWIFDMKEQGTPSASALVHCGDLKRAKRVVMAMQACLARPPRMLGTTKLGDLSMLVRRLAPQEDKLLLSRLADVDLLPLARYLGALTGAAHRRGATNIPKKPWSAGERSRIVDHAITLAGIHEAAYLAMCRWR